MVIIRMFITIELVEVQQKLVKTFNFNLKRATSQITECKTRRIAATGPFYTTPIKQSKAYSQS